MIAMILLPALITYCSNRSNHPQSQEQTEQSSKTEIVFPEITKYNEFEQYIKGVVAAEMPALFEEEALKAQAVSARTYAIRSMNENNSNEVPYDIGQAYITTEQMKQKWGEHFTEYYNRISEAVEQTKGEIMVYENEPILAVFHAESGGKTEEAKNVWQQEIPYLKSVDSSLDENAPDFLTSISFSFEEIIQHFSSQYTDFSATPETLPQQCKIISRSPAGYVQQMQIGNKTVTGAQVRQILHLRSTNFDIEIKNNQICFTTKGYGHGAGMSQYGAQFMAKEGKTYRQILQHYYTDISFSQIEM